MAGMTPTQLTLRMLRKMGYTAAVVEKWNPHARIRQDLFGIIDVIGVRDGETIGVQSTSRTNVNARVKKIADSDTVGAVRDANWILHVHGWHKKNNRWQCHVVDVS